MWAGIYGSKILQGWPSCPKCGKPVTVHYAEREYETDNPEYDENPDADPLASCAAIQAWVECHHCSWVFGEYDERVWSDEIIGNASFEDMHIDQAINGAVACWRDHERGYITFGNRVGYWHMWE